MIQEHIEETDAMVNREEYRPLVVHQLPEQVDNSLPFIDSCLADIREGTRHAEQALSEKYGPDSNKFKFLMDVCKRATNRLSEKYKGVQLAQRGIVTERSLHCNAAAPYEQIEGGAHDMHYFTKGMVAVLHGEEFHLVKDALYGLNAITAWIILPFKYLAHRTMHEQIGSHPARLLEDLDANDIVSLFHALCLGAISAWDHQIPEVLTQQNIREEQRKWTERLIINIDSSFLLLSTNHCNLSLQDTHDRVLALTINQQRHLTMIGIMYPAANYPELIDVYKILSGITPSNMSHLSLQNDIAENLIEKANLSGRFLLDVLEFLKNNNCLISTNAALLVPLGCTLASINKAKTAYARINQVLTYVSQNMTYGAPNDYITNYSEQKKFIDTLLFNFIKHESGLDFKSFKNIAFLRQQYDFPKLSIQYHAGANQFIALSRTGGLPLAKDNVAVLSEEITQINARLVEANRIIDEKKASVVHIQAQCDDFKRRYDVCVSDIENIMNRVELIMSDSMCTEDELEEVKAEKRELQAENAALLEKNASVTNRAELLETQNSELKDELRQLKKLHAYREDDNARKGGRGDRGYERNSMFYC